MRLLGIIDKKDSRLMLIQNKNNFFVEEESKEKFDNYELVKNRDAGIGNPMKNGEGVFNFRYGPVTAGVGEAGIFNICTYGEKMLSINIDTAYKQRNLEEKMIGKTPNYALALAESISGNFAFSHSLAFSRAIERLLRIKTNSTTQRTRIIALELERIYNHIHVISKLSNRAAQNVLTSHLEWIFEECLRINKVFGSSRFLKGINRIGGIDIKEDVNLDEILNRIKNVKSKFEDLYIHSLKSWNFVDRIYKTAVIDKKKAYSIGITGPSLRACGIACDLREYEGLYDNFSIVTKEDGDSLSRMEVRAQEILNSCDIIVSQIGNLGNQDSNSLDNQDNKQNTESDYSVGFAESPSGIIADYVEMKDGLINSVYISTPSVFGYKAFTDSAEGYIFTDFSFALDSFGINFADCAR